MTVRLDCDLTIAYNNLSDRFCGLYVGNFAAQFAIQPEEVTRQWKNTLLQFKAETIEAALDYIESGQTRFTKFPPAPLEFREICLDMRNMGYGVDEKPVEQPAAADAAITAAEREVNKKRDAIDPLWRQKVAQAETGYHKMMIMSILDYGSEDKIPEVFRGILRAMAFKIEQNKKRAEAE